MRKLLWLPVLLLMTSVAMAVVFEPQDRSKTLSEIVPLRGQVEGGGSLEVNGQPLSLKNGRFFECGLVLKPGKNLVEVQRGEAKQKIRILRLVSFPDIDAFYQGKKHWAQSYIVYMATLGVVEGFPDGNYYPDSPVTRGEFSTWLIRAKKMAVKPPAEDVFLDVPKEHWRAPFIKAIVDAGYLKGYSNNNFGIDDPVLRREAAEIAVMTQGLGVIEKIKPLFRDVPQAERSALPIYTAQEKGLVIGVNKKIPVYAPDRPLTRAEAAALLSRFIESQRGIAELISYDLDYTAADLCRLDVSPEVTELNVTPTAVHLKETASLRLRARVAPRGQFYPIARVKADLTDIGGLPDAEMFDDGTHGDDEAGDLVYSLNASFTPTEIGVKSIEITVTDKLGWEAKKAVTLTIQK